MSYIWHDEKNTTSTQTKPKLYVNIEAIPPLKDDESFKYLGRYFNFSMNYQKQRRTLRNYNHCFE